MAYRALLRRLISSVRREGLGPTFIKLQVLLAEQWFDFRYGLDTCAFLELDGLTIGSNNRAKGYRYQPTPVLPLKKLFRAIQPLLPDKRILVDFGGGKGRVLLVASQFGFQEIRSIEFAHELCEVAKENCDRYQTRIAKLHRWAVLEGDAACYMIRPEENVFFMFNPFDAEVLSIVLRNIEDSLRYRSRRIFIIYYNPKWSCVIDERSGFSRFRELIFWGHKFIVYTNSSIK